MCRPGGNSDFYLISLSALKKAGLCKWQKQIEFIFTALESVGFIVSNGFMSLSSFSPSSFSSRFSLHLQVLLLSDNSLGKLTGEKSALCVCRFFFPSAAPSELPPFICPALWPGRPAYMNCLLQYPLSSGFVHLVAGSVGCIHPCLSPVAVTLHGFWELPSAFTPSGQG